MTRLGAALRDGGLHPRALAAWAGTDRLSALPRLRITLATRELTPAGAVLALFVGGDDVPVDRLRGLDLAALHDLALVDVVGPAVRARVAVLPIGASLVVCDRQDRAADRDLVCWPDDSSYHLAGALPPGRKARWLDLGCGSAVAPLGRPELAEAIVCADINPRAVEFARLGAALSGVGHVTTWQADLGDGVPPGPYDLVSCNCPIPQAGEDPRRPRWQQAGADFVGRVFGHAAALVAPGGIVVVHALAEALAPAVAELPGERVIVTYTPDGAQGFGVAWWRPDAEPRHVVARRSLTALRPHLSHEDRTAALDGPAAC